MLSSINLQSLGPGEHCRTKMLREALNGLHKNEVDFKYKLEDLHYTSYPYRSASTPWGRQSFLQRFDVMASSAAIRTIPKNPERDGTVDTTYIDCHPTNDSSDDEQHFIRIATHRLPFDFMNKWHACAQK